MALTPFIGQDGKTWYKDANGSLWTAEEVGKASSIGGENQNMMQQNTPSSDTSIKQGTTQIGKDGKKYKWNAAAGSWMVDNTPSTETPYNNPDNMAPVLPTDYAGQMNLATPVEEAMLMQDAIANYKEGSGTQGIDTASKKAEEIMNREDIYSKQIAESGGGKNVEDYIRAMYEGSADPLRREADKRMQQQQADLAARGLGMSTVVNDVNSNTQNELLALLGDLAHKSTVAGRELNLNALKSAADVYGQSNAQQLGAAQDVAGYSTQKQAQQLQGANAVNQLINQQEARRLTNIQLPMQEWDKRVSNYWNYMGIPQTAYSGQNATQATAANVGQGNFQQANANAAGQNQLAGNVGSVLASAFQKQKPTWQPINTNTANTTQNSILNTAKFNPVFGGINQAR